ncbi:MAG: thiamine-binding protein [Clostridia bacterium]|nr:thiamine-binding protein [Clostridia bacterium]
MTEASVAIQVLPKVSETAEVLRIVDKVIEYIASTGFKYFVGPFETTIEGDYDSLMEIVKECNKICIREGAGGVSTYVKISYNPEGVLTIGEKVDKYM